MISRPKLDSIDETKTGKPHLQAATVSACYFFARKESGVLFRLRYIKQAMLRKKKRKKSKLKDREVKRKKETDKQTDRQTDRQTEGQKDETEINLRDACCSMYVLTFNRSLGLTTTWCSFALNATVLRYVLFLLKVCVCLYSTFFHCMFVCQFVLFSFIIVRSSCLRFLSVSLSCLNLPSGFSFKDSL